jgi:hypothetical protein
MIRYNDEERRAIAVRRKELKVLASSLIGSRLKNLGFPHSVTVSARNIKEILNQPHKHYREKNESVLHLDKLFEQSLYLGELDRRKGVDFDSFLFQTTIGNECSWIIVRKYDRGKDYIIYSISDQSNLLTHIKEKEDS